MLPLEYGVTGLICIVAAPLLLYHARSRGQRRG